jgi:nucleotide-binding universal stress UspA family protein
MASGSAEPSVIREKGGAMKKIILAIDGSAHSQEAVEFGLELAVEQQAEVTFVHVLPPDEFVVAGRLGPAMPIQHREPMDESETVLKEAAQAAEKAGVSYKLEQISGTPVDAILALADEQDADLIVTGSHGRGAIGSALLGSVSTELVKRAKRPVLVVKTTSAKVPA